MTRVCERLGFSSWGRGSFRTYLFFGCIWLHVNKRFKWAADKFCKITFLDMKEKIIRKVENGANVYYIYKRCFFGLGRWLHVGTRTESDMMNYLHSTFNLWDEIIINFKK